MATTAKNDIKIPALVNGEPGWFSFSELQTLEAETVTTTPIPDPPVVVKPEPVPFQYAGMPRLLHGYRAGAPIYVGKGMNFYMEIYDAGTSKERIYRRGTNLSFDRLPGMLNLALKGNDTDFGGLDYPETKSRIADGYRLDYPDSDTSHRQYWTPGTDPDRIYTHQPTRSLSQRVGRFARFGQHERFCERRLFRRRQD